MGRTNPRAWPGVWMLTAACVSRRRPSRESTYGREKLSVVSPDLMILGDLARGVSFALGWRRLVLGGFRVVAGIVSGIASRSPGIRFRGWRCGCGPGWRTAARRSWEAAGTGWLRSRRRFQAAAVLGRRVSAASFGRLRSVIQETVPERRDVDDGDAFHRAQAQKIVISGNEPVRRPSDSAVQELVVVG